MIESTDEKMQALLTVDPDTSIVMESPGKWFVHSPNRDEEHRIGASPQEAIDLEWAAVSDGHTLILHPGKRNERRVKWSMIMMVDVAVPKKTRKSRNSAPDAPAPDAAPKAEAELSYKDNLSENGSLAAKAVSKKQAGA